jgi:hypothetical protein
VVFNGVDQYMRLPTLSRPAVEVSMWIWIHHVQPNPLFYLLDARGVDNTEQFIGNKLLGNAWGDVRVDTGVANWTQPLSWHALPIGLWAHVQVKFGSSLWLCVITLTLRWSNQ